ncbi:hypothetical protein MKW98_006214 [Papaver atlanticum]|uniref:U-box domain-containing protein n=1 Tax=Papaver atlanticum TaxID=357466 RepID=A0AAD4XWT9_9MAGN|nr:hypothetical protein MKW98_006214 [Papaver atlanticum]
MEDPVVLPLNSRMDRSVIQKTYFQVPYPFSGKYLTEDMLVSDDRLKARIEEFISSSSHEKISSPGAQDDYSDL